MKRFLAKIQSLPASYRAWLQKRFDKNPHRSFRRTRAHVRRQSLFVITVKGSWRLVSETLVFIWRQRRIALWLGLLYAVLAYFLVGGVSQVDYNAFKDASQKVFGGEVGAITTAFSLFGAAFSGALSSQPSELQQFLSAFLAIFFWLALVWAARMLSAGKTIKLRGALYNSGGPFVPTLVILGVICLQLIPAAVGVFAYAAVTNGQWVQGGVESMAFAGAMIGLCLLSLYWLTASMVGLVVVTLPGMYPLRALATARDLVVDRRWSIVARLIVASILLVLIWAAVLVPAFLLDNWLRFSWLPLIPVAMQLLFAFSLVFLSVYTYKLYRSLL